MEPDAFLEAAYEDRHIEPVDFYDWDYESHQEEWFEDDPDFPAGTIVKTDDMTIAGVVKRVNTEGWAEVVYVGDDIRHLYEVECLTKIEREEFCGQCGQIGCGHDGLERS